MDPDVKAKAVSGQVTAGTGSIVVRQANRNRSGLMIVNDSDVTVYLSYGEIAVINTGIRLNAGGGSLEINATNLYRGPISCITSAPTKILTYIEVE